MGKVLWWTAAGGVTCERDLSTSLIDRPRLASCEACCSAACEIYFKRSFSTFRIYWRALLASHLDVQFLNQITANDRMVPELVLEDTDHLIL